MTTAPHLIRATKKSVGLPNWDQATERQRRDGMCWKTEDEIYNNGGAFKLTCRDERGIMVTILAHNYFGYCKKEVKTQISFAANLSGFCEEEHAGGALVFPTYDLGEALANLVQPFWMLPVLGLLGLRARDVMGYTFLAFLALFPLVLALVSALAPSLPYPL